MSDRMTRASRGLVMLALGGLMLQRIWSGTLVWFVNPRTLGLTWMAALGMIAIAGSLLDVRKLRRAPAVAGSAAAGSTAASEAEKKH